MPVGSAIGVQVLYDIHGRELQDRLTSIWQAVEDHQPWDHTEPSEVSIFDDLRLLGSDLLQLITFLWTQLEPVSDLVGMCADGAKNHGKYVSCVAHLTNDLKKAGEITGAEKGAINSCAGQADLP